MSLSRRNFLTDASVFGLLTALLPEFAAAQAASPQAPTEDLPHDSYDFWNGFFDSVNPNSPNYGNKAASRGPTDQLPDPRGPNPVPALCAPQKRLRYATDIQKEELLDHDGDVAVSIALSQFRPGARGNQSACVATARGHNPDSPLREHHRSAGLVGHRVG